MPASRLAVTGGAAEGKSTVLGYLAALGVRTASADEAAALVLARPEVRARVAYAAGLPEGFDRAELWRVLLGSPESRRSVNAVLHRPVVDALEAEDAAAVEIPLLFEACLWAEFGYVWVVTCGPEEQLRRLESRLGNREDAALSAGMQVATAAKAALADAVVRTNRPESDVSSDVAGLAVAFGLV